MSQQARCGPHALARGPCHRVSPASENRAQCSGTPRRVTAHTTRMVLVPQCKMEGFFSSHVLCGSYSRKKKQYAGSPTHETANLNTTMLSSSSRPSQIKYLADALSPRHHLPCSVFFLCQLSPCYALILLPRGFRAPVPFSCVGPHGGSVSMAPQLEESGGRAAEL